MKTIITTFSICCLLGVGLSDNLYSITTVTSLIHDETQRNYRVYTPSSYTGDTESPLIIALPGYEESAVWMQMYSEFDPLADTAGCIIVYAEGLPDAFDNHHWNTTGNFGTDTIDDVGFINRLIDTVCYNYAVDTNRIYCVGESNGGFMTYILASELNHRISAIGIVAGTMWNEEYFTYPVEHPTPVIHIHGTLDTSVPYYGSDFTRPVEDVIEYWVDTNNCDPNPVITNIPNTVSGDQSTVKSFEYSGGPKNANVKLLKVINGYHTWPGFLGNMDIKSSIEIWNFISRYRLDTLTSPYVHISDPEPEPDPDPQQGLTFETITAQQGFSVFPNPATTFIQVNIDTELPVMYEIYSSLGGLLMIGSIESDLSVIDIDKLDQGTYYIKIKDKYLKIIKAQ